MPPLCPSAQLTGRSRQARPQENQNLQSINHAALRRILSEKGLRLVRQPPCFNGFFTPRSVNLVHLVPKLIYRFMTFFLSRMDICDDPASLVITASFELPGVRREEIKLKVHEGNLMLFGQRRLKLIPHGTPPSNVPLSPPCHPDRSASTERMARGAVAFPVIYPIQEIRYGKFHRSVPLPLRTKVSVHYFPVWLYITNG